VSDSSPFPVTYDSMHRTGKSGARKLVNEPHLCELQGRRRGYARLDQRGGADGVAGRRATTKLLKKLFTANKFTE
jgi:hypothetical protein